MGILASIALVGRPGNILRFGVKIRQSRRSSLKTLYVFERKWYIIIKIELILILILLFCQQNWKLQGAQHNDDLAHRYYVLVRSLASPHAPRELSLLLDLHISLTWHLWILRTIILNHQELNAYQLLHISLAWQNWICIRTILDHQEFNPYQSLHISLTWHLCFSTEIWTNFGKVHKNAFLTSTEGYQFYLKINLFWCTFISGIHVSQECL